MPDLAPYISSTVSLAALITFIWCYLSTEHAKDGING